MIIYSESHLLTNILLMFLRALEIVFRNVENAFMFAWLNSLCTSQLSLSLSLSLIPFSLSPSLSLPPSLSVSSPSLFPLPSTTPSSL